jgi:predicted DNA-binding WGR domain protein
MPDLTDQEQRTGGDYLDQVKAQWDCLVYVGGGSDKFWRVRSSGRYLQTWWGRNGTSGQRLAKQFPTALLALQEREKLTQSKLAKGYAWEVDPKAKPPGTWGSMTPAQRKLAIMKQQAEAAAVAAAKLAAAQKPANPLIVLPPPTSAQLTPIDSGMGKIKMGKRETVIGSGSADGLVKQASPATCHGASPPPDPGAPVALGRFSALQFNEEEDDGEL